MTYRYETEREGLFNDSGQRTFLKIRDRAQHLLKTAGAARVEEIISGCTGDTWQMLACVDRLVELGELREITNAASVAGQHRVFVRA